MEKKAKETKMTKVMILNAGPRKNFNTAKMLKEAAKGAQETGTDKLNAAKGKANDNVR